MTMLHRRPPRPAKKKDAPDVLDVLAAAVRMAQAAQDDLRATIEALRQERQTREGQQDG